jgi:hypothetical protein
VYDLKRASLEEVVCSKKQKVYLAFINLDVAMLGMEEYGLSDRLGWPTGKGTKSMAKVQDSFTSISPLAVIPNHNYLLPIRPIILLNSEWRQGEGYQRAA